MQGLKTRDIIKFFGDNILEGWLLNDEKVTRWESNCLIDVSFFNLNNNFGLLELLKHENFKS